MIKSYAVLAPKQPLAPFEYDPGPLGATDVRINITHCGICYSDIAYIDNHFGDAMYPLIPGHEIIGKVSAIGDGVKHLSVGQRVGVGPLRSACLHCEWCERGQENLCTKLQMTITGGNHGGFAEAMQLDGSFAFPIPDALPSESAAPLLCAGLTVYSPLHDHTHSSMRVGIIGIGGLGHIALQFANKLGNEVTAFSTSASKEQEAKAFGAHRFVNTSDAAQVTKAAGSLDFILSTVYADIDWMTYLNVLRPNGKICIVGASLNPIGIPSAFLIMGQKSICGSAAGGRARMREMLDFATRHGIRAQTVLAPATELNAAVDRVRKNSVRYRMVLTASASAH
jgi:alcohol/geraniol dehydrogenase (NADP+)